MPVDTGFVCDADAGMRACEDRSHYRTSVTDAEYDNLRRKCENLIRTVTAPDYHCRPLVAEVSDESYVTISGDVVERPEKRFMNRFLREWSGVPDLRRYESNKVLPVVDTWNDVGAHGGSKYDTEFLWSARTSGWQQNEGNITKKSLGTVPLG
ncbi:hypothetical protein CYMTET_30884 [Cymbomonas tetramitiformis]|uniref:Uncharacterized protein n=1 Tax=Cymbomonas tetramitiformis TaxID=36881 RepID=A0AAE0KTG7_9CHLO|nr:hypothetical protein CYMTET_30884 [Cymbomonas tetramitiformis]